MNFREPGTLAILALILAMLLLPGRGLMLPALWFSQAHVPVILLMAAIIFCAVYFGLLKFWELVTGDRLPKPLPAILALFLLVRLTVDCARMLMWR